MESSTLVVLKWLRTNKSTILMLCFVLYTLMHRLVQYFLHILKYVWPLYLGLRLTYGYEYRSHKFSAKQLSIFREIVLTQTDRIVISLTTSYVIASRSVFINARLGCFCVYLGY